MWGTLPYLDSQGVHELFEDLPRVVSAAAASPVNLACGLRASLSVASTKEIKEDPGHLRGQLSPSEFLRLTDRYRAMPERYFLDRTRFVSPRTFSSSIADRKGIAQLWEICSGTSILSSVARDMKVSHLPPIDHRYGWSLERAEDQLIVIATLLGVGAELLVISPNCHPWGNNSRALEEKERKLKRDRERHALTFIAVCCFVQHMLGRKYILENPKGSDIFLRDRLR